MKSGMRKQCERKKVAEDALRSGPARCRSPRMSYCAVPLLRALRASELSSSGGRSRCRCRPTRMSTGLSPQWPTQAYGWSVSTSSPATWRPDCGVLSLPARAVEFRDNVDVVIGIGKRLGVTAFNALYGNRLAGVNPAAQDELATEQFGYAAKAAAAIDAMVLVEAVSGPKPYPLRTAADAVAVVDRVGAANVGFLCDIYHLATNGDDMTGAIQAHADRIAHVQIADAPGRGEPGTGTLDIAGYLAALDTAGYRGYVGLEYRPTTTTLDSLAWLPVRQRSSH